VSGGTHATALIHDHLLFIGETEGDATVERRLVQDMLDRGVDGFLYASMYTRETRVSSALRGHPLVLLNCLGKDRRVTSVIPDEREAGRTAARTLVEAGHREGIYIVGETPPRVYASRERRTGVEDVLNEEGLPLAGTVDCLWWPEPAYAAVRAFLAGGSRPSALICLNDRIAFGAYQALAETGLAVPEDVSVVSFDDSDLASWLRPQLTSVAIPHFELGRRAVELLLANPRAGGAHLVPMPLRQRASVDAPRATGSRRRTHA
jgi:LacI family transcriptional regulator